MKAQEIRQLVEYLEDRILNNFEIHFSYLVLEDFYSGGFEDRIRDEFFYEEYFSRYESKIIDLLLLMEDNEDNVYKDFKIRLIKLKRTIDNYLLKSDETTDQEHRVPRAKKFLFNDSETLDTLHSKLIENKLIELSDSNFKDILSNKSNEKIQWLGTEIQITNLINLLITHNYLDGENSNQKYSLISNYFTNKQNKPFRAKQLAAVYSDKSSSIPDDDIINKLVTHL